MICVGGVRYIRRAARCLLLTDFFGGFLKSVVLLFLGFNLVEVERSVVLVWFFALEVEGVGD